MQRIWIGDVFASGQVEPFSVSTVRTNQCLI